ncbi:MAG: hypothetical protein AB2A00_25005 [Myxococcota bacterium]
MTAVHNNGLDGMLSALGLSRQLAEQVGGSLKAGRLDAASLQALLTTMPTGVSTQSGLAGGAHALPPSGYVARPRDYLAEQLAEAALPVGNGFGGINGEDAYGPTRLGHSLQAMMIRNPAMAQQMEKLLKGTLVPDGRDDGRFTVYQSPHTRTGACMKQAQQAGVVGKSPFTLPLANLNVSMTNPAVANGPTGGILKGLMAMEANITNMVGSFNKTGGGLPAGMQQMAQMMGMNPNSANFEDIVQLQLMYYATTKEQEIAAKVQSLDKGNAVGGFYGGLTDPNAGGQTARRLFDYSAPASGNVQAQTAPQARVTPRPQAQTAATARPQAQTQDKNYNAQAAANAARWDAMGQVVEYQRPIQLEDGRVLINGRPVPRDSPEAQAATYEAWAARYGVTDGSQVAILGPNGNTNGAGGKVQGNVYGMSYGQQITGGGVSAVGGAGGAGGFGAGADGGYNGLLSGVGQGLPSNPNQMSDTMKQQMLQKLMSDLQKMYEMLSNMLKSMHEMQMTPIRSLRG